MSPVATNTMGVFSSSAVTKQSVEENSNQVFSSNLGVGAYVPSGASKGYVPSNATRPNLLESRNSASGTKPNIESAKPSFLSRQAAKQTPSVNNADNVVSGSTNLLNASSSHSSKRP